MSLLLGPRRREDRADRPTDSLAELYRRREMPTAAGVHVDTNTAMRHGAVFGCIDLIGRQVSTLPVHEYRRTVDGALEVQKSSPLLESPDGELDFCGWCYAQLASVLKAGNAYGFVEAVGSNGWPIQIATVHPGDVSWARKGRRGPVEWRLDGTRIERWPAGELWHMPAYTVAGSPVGLSPISYAALTIGTGLAAQQFGSRWFRDGAVPTAVLKNDGEVSQSAAQLVKQRWLDALAGNREPVVLGNGWTHDLVSVNAEESQFLESIAANTADVCRFFGCDPVDVGAAPHGGSSITYANVESRQLQLLVRTIGPWIVRLEKALSRLLPRPKQVRFTLEGFLRVDTLTRVKAYETAVRNGWMSVNEVRQLEDRPGIGPDGDRYLWPPLRSQLSEEEIAEGADSLARSAQTNSIPR